MLGSTNLGRPMCTLEGMWISPICQIKPPLLSVYCGSDPNWAPHTEGLNSCLTVTPDTVTSLSQTVSYSIMCDSNSPISRESVLTAPNESLGKREGRVLQFSLLLKQPQKSEKPGEKVEIRDRHGPEKRRFVLVHGSWVSQIMNFH
ncbi:UNVERIFIED_CONTAM: hypothetical protein K2H54_048488 [Gekko kuhli]